MAILAETLLETPDYGQQGLEAIITANMELLDAKAVIQNADGHQLIQAPATAAPDGEIALSRLHISLDEPGDKIRFKWKESGGTVMEKTLPGAGASSDELVGVSGNDTTPGYLFNKTVAGDNIVLAELNDGADEDLEITGLYPPGHISGLKTEWVSASSVKINTGECLSDDGTTNLKLTSPITGDISSKLDTGVEAEWLYVVLLIYNPTADTYDILYTLNPGSPTFPAGFTKKRIVGFARNNASQDFLEFRISGEGKRRRYRYQDTSLTNVLSGGGATTWTTVDVSYYMPVSESNEAILYVNNGNQDVELRANGETVAYNYTVSTTGNVTFDQFTDASGLFEYQNVAGGGSVDIDLVGFVWEL